MLLLALSACPSGGPKKDTTPPPPDPDAWRKQSLSLDVEGYVFTGSTKPGGASWKGSGAWIGPNLAVTNAHVALRGLKITGKDDLGKVYEFNNILAVNEEADLAIIEAKPGSDSFLPLVDKPADPRSLRGMNVRVIGNTGGLGLSFYDGRITNVVGENDDWVILHDANTAGGASGGPLITKEGKLVGVNHSSIPSVNAKAAAPSWTVKKTWDSAGGNPSKALKDAFDPAGVKIDWYVERAVCLKPGEAFKAPFNTVATNDLVAELTPAQNAPIGFALVSGSNEVLADAVVTSTAVGAWTLMQKGTYTFYVVNDKAATAPVCATVKFGRIDWAAKLKN